MQPVRRAVLLPLLFTALLASLVITGCGGGKTSSTARPVFDGVRARTVAAGPVHFRILISINAGGTRITAEENGTASFTRRRAHLV